MKITSLSCLFWVFTTATLAIEATGNMPSQFNKMPRNRVVSLSPQYEILGTALLSEEPNGFPFTMQESKFLLNEEEVFLNIIGYQPLEPEQDISGDIREERVRDDLRKWEEYRSDFNPIAIRVYPGPNEDEPNRMPKVFYDGVRDLGFWVIRDIYFDQNFCDPNYEKNGEAVIDSVLAEVKNANALDLIFAWEIGNEFPNNETTLCWNTAKIKRFIEAMCIYLRSEVYKLGRNDVSNWVTWASYPPHDPLYTDGAPLEPNCLDYISYNVYSYHPERIRDHQTGPVTGTPYQGYLAGLKECYQDKPLVISETGFSDSNQTVNQDELHSWYPTYTYGGMSSEQIAEGLAGRYWDARLLRDTSDTNDPNIVIAGLSIFEWNDEWHKGGSNPNEDNELPEEHFGLSYFIERLGQNGYQLRYKLQQETVRELYNLNFNNDANIIEDVVADDNSVAVGESTRVRAVISQNAAAPVCLRWESSRGYIIGDPNCIVDPNNQSEPNSVIFYSGKAALGPATVTIVAIDANGNVDRVSTSIDIEITEPNRIEILTSGISTLGEHKFSGRVHNVDLTKHKLVCYLLNWQLCLVPKPFDDMTSIWINKQGYWWSTAYRDPADHIYCWLVPKSCNLPPEDQEFGWSPPCAIAEVSTINMNPNTYRDDDDDLLPDWWEPVSNQDRYDDFDDDGASNLEEFLTGTSPTDANDNDSDGDGLLDNWERRFFGDQNFYDANDDPDGDGLTNSEELALGLHPVRVAADKDRDEMPDTWEMRWFETLAQDANDNFDDDCFNNLIEYELGLDPIICMGNLNCDWHVNLFDFSMFAARWQEADCNKPDWCVKADLNRDGEVTLTDLCVLIENWLMEL